MTQAIANEGRFKIDTGVNKWGATADVSPNGRHMYSNKAPGSSMLAVPVYVAIKLVAGAPSLAFSLWICRVAAGIVPTLVFLWLLWGFLARFAPDPAIRKLVICGYALGSMAMTYSILFYSHQLGAVCAGVAWILAVEVTERKRGWWAMVAAGAFAGSSLLVDYQAVFATVPIAALVVVRIWSWPRREMLRMLGAAGLGAAVPIGILLGYHTAAFDSPFRTGYDASTTFANFHQQGFLGITTLRWEAFCGSMFKPDNGLVTLMPWVLLAIPGSITLARKGERAMVLTCAAVAVIFVLFVSSINFWRGGWGVGPRYITAMLPFLLPMVAAQLQAWKDRPLLLGAAASTFVIAVIIYCASSITFPYWPDNLNNPFGNVILRLLGEGLVAGNLGSALGLGAIASVVPFVALIIASFGVALYRAATPKGCAIAVVIGLAVCVGYALIPETAGHAEHVYQFVRAAMVDV